MVCDSLAHVGITGPNSFEAMISKSCQSNSEAPFWGPSSTKKETGIQQTLVKKCLEQEP